MLKTTTVGGITLETPDLPWPSSSKVCNHIPNFRPMNNFLQSGSFFEANSAIHISRLGLNIQISCLTGVRDSSYWPRSR